ncbi:MAG: two component, sigma54 specific, transcriptional regulator, Fis family [Candidatus Aminicenantes bacterium]|nr:two component, sigma54 specific, transcriptional regulator, Fis family [Candidatus Aminicenantes bacterium]
MDEKTTVHVIDDEPIIHEVLSQLLSSEGYEVELSSSGEEALEKHSAQLYDITILDLLMPGLDGIQVLQGIKKVDPQAVVIIITAYASVESAISAMKMGAYDYIQKPFKHDELLLTIERALEHRKLQDENIRLRGELKRRFGFENIIGHSQPMQKIFELITAIAPTRSTILVQGESGTGKELVARAIHQNSDRSHFPFVVVNSGTLPPDLLESHLFGHVKGAFTGAVSQKDGLFETADRGSIFFDEISTIGLETQAKLLRVMQDKEFMRLGGVKTIRVDARILAATNTDLEELIERKAFRPDLFYRLNVIKIELPPLRERKDDIPLLVKHFVDIYARENKKEIEGVTDDVLEVLEDYDWPGNVRELENLVERAVVLSKSRLITRNTLPPFLLDRRAGDRDADGGRTGERSLKEQTRQYQKRVILNALRHAGGVQKQAAQALGLKPTTLNEMIKRLKIEVDNLS